MRKIITIIASTFISVGLSAQIVPGQNHNGLLKAKNDKITMSGDEALSHLMVNPNPHAVAVLNSNSKSTITEEVIGITTYDLQSNASIQNRIILHDDGKISAGWTMSQEYNNSYIDRGTGYNFFDGTSWGTQPTTRLESSRGGWPSIIALGNGGECAITHNTNGRFINNTSRAYVGTGTWTEDTITTDYLIWNRSAAGGIDGNTIHMVALTEPSGGTWTGVPFNGVSGALLYYRSQDGGVTWDITGIQLPGMDSLTQIAMSGDVYAIAAQDTTVVIAYFDDWGDSFIVKSTDNGNTWTKTTFLDFPVDKYTTNDGFDLDNNDTTDHVFSSDNCGTVILDANGQAHVFYGVMQYSDDDLADDGTSWYPATNMLAYWNESYGADYSDSTLQDTVGYIDAAGVVTARGRWWSDMMNNHVIAAAPDLNGDCFVDGIDSTGGYALYYNSRASMPSAGIDSLGNMYLSFSGYTENIDNNNQVFRHIYIIQSSDGGITWSNPIDVTPVDIFPQECVFGSMAKIVDDKIRIVYQKDFEPGLAVRGDGTNTGFPGYGDFVDENKIIYLEINAAQAWDYCVYGCTDSLAGNYNANAECDNGCCDNATPSAIDEVVDYKNSIDIYPNPTSKSTDLNIYSITNTTTTISIINLIGEVVHTDIKQLSIGINTETIDVSKYQNGIYFVNLQIGSQVTTKKLVITK